MLRLYRHSSPNCFRQMNDFSHWENKVLRSSDWLSNSTKWRKTKRKKNESMFSFKKKYEEHMAIMFIQRINRRIHLGSVTRRFYACYSLFSFSFFKTYISKHAKANSPKFVIMNLQYTTEMFFEGCKRIHKHRK